jgi:DNA-directed RNA polymerase specialized sigma24 family protein
METVIELRKEKLETRARNSRQESINACLDMLPVLYRLPVLLVDVKGMDCSEAASVLRISHETLKSRLARGRVKMQVACKQLSGYWMEQAEKNRKVERFCTVLAEAI